MQSRKCFEELCVQMYVFEYGRPICSYDWCLVSTDNVKKIDLNFNNSN